MSSRWTNAALATAIGQFLTLGAASGTAPTAPDQCLIAPSSLAAAIASEEAIAYESSYRAACPGGQAPAFLGAQGFGACATGGRGGQVIEVTSLAATRDPGTLQWALDQAGPKTIVFRVSGVIDRAIEITQPDVTIAGQTSPGGITVRGILCDNQVYERSHTCTNVIMRHIRSRPSANDVRPNQGDVLDDAARIDGGQRVIFDHLSLSGGNDETFQISRASDVTIQNSALSELVSDHPYSGMLINYSSVAHPLQNISLHHNLWNRQLGRLPEINCEPNEDDGSSSNCVRRLNLEISNNLTWDQGSEITYGGADGLRVDLNWVGNMGFNRTDYTQPLISDEVFGYSDNRIYLSDDRYFQFPQLLNYALAGCCNDWASDPEFNAQRPVPQTVINSRITHPAISYTPAANLMSYALRYMGAFPRDPQDRRLLYPIAQRQIAVDGLWNARSNNPCGDAFDTDAAPVAPLDIDHDGMPDDWETANGLDPSVNDAMELDLAAFDPLLTGMTNLEVYLHFRHLQLLGLRSTAQPTRLLNIATRGKVETVDNVMIAGFIIQGSSAKKVLIRARGPSLAAAPFNVPGTLADPFLTLYSGATPIDTNDDFAQHANAAQIPADWTPASAKEAAIVTTLSPGAYTAIVNGVGATSGVAIVEVFELDQPGTPLINIATRGPVQTGDNVMIAGLIIQGDAPQTVLITARGPSMAGPPHNVPGTLSDPVLTLFSGQTPIASNDNWPQAANAAQIQTAIGAPTNTLESAILITLQPGAYTAIVNGASNATGLGIVEVFAQ
jgi:pectate lyase